MRLGVPEIGLILIIVLIVFGVGRLPEVGGAIGRSIRNFKKAQAGEDDERGRASPSEKTEATVQK